MKMKTIFVYGGFLALCFLSFFGSVHAQSSEIVDVKIDFAWVQDVSGEQPNKTAACIIAWVAEDAEEKVFCGYGTGKNGITSRDNDVIDRILHNMKLRPATSEDFPKKIEGWLANIEKGLQEKKLPPVIMPQISEFFAYFLKTGVKNYAAYPTNENGLFKFKSAKPHNLDLLKKLDSPTAITNEIFAFLVHYEVHRAVSESGESQTPTPDQKPGSEPSTTPVKPDAETPLNDPRVDDLLKAPKIRELLINPAIVTFLEKLGGDEKAFNILIDDKSRALLVEQVEVSKRAGRSELLASEGSKTLDNPPGEQETVNSPVEHNLANTIFAWIEKNLMVILAISGGVLLLILLFIIRLRQSSKKSQPDSSEIQISSVITKEQVKTIAVEVAAMVLKKEMTLDKKTKKELVTEITGAVTDMVSEKKFLLSDDSKTDLVRKILKELSNEKLSLKEGEIEQIAKAVTLDEQSKREILHAISAQKAKVQQEHEELEQSRATAQNQLTETQQHLTKTEGELSQTQTELERMTKSLQTLMVKRFGIVKHELLPQLSEQKGTWLWLQSVLVAQCENYYNALSTVKNSHDPESQKIIELLNLNSILTHWQGFITENPHLESDKRLLGLLEARDAGMWLSNILRADELLKTYFSDKAQLESLITPLAIAAMMLQAALQELGVEVIKPALLESPPASLPQSARKKAENPILMELVHGKVMPKLEKAGKLVVDIERYGFVTQGTPKMAMKVLVADLGGWEFFNNYTPR